MNADREPNYENARKDRHGTVGALRHELPALQPFSERGKAVPGMFNSDENKPGRCRNCFKKECAAARNVTYCFECEEYPCSRMKYMEKTYTAKYRISLYENGRFVQEYGLEAFMEREKRKWICSCGGVVSVHERVCSECGQKV